MKKMLIPGIAAVVAVMMMSGCGNTGSDSASAADTTAAPAETTAADAEGAETTAAASETPTETLPLKTTVEAVTTAPAETAPAETTAPTDTAADTAVTTTENDFLKGLNEQMAQFEEGVGNISIDGGTAPTVSYAEVPAETKVSAASAPAASGDTMAAGDDDHGYVDVPADWQMTTAPDKGKWDIIRYHDAAGQNIISLQRYENTLANMAADKIYDLIDDSPLTEITGSCHTEVCGLSTYRIDAKILAEDHRLIIWVMQDESGDARYLSAESPDEQFILNIASTYRLTK